jgi:KUP system potassium uptake protein
MSTWQKGRKIITDARGKAEGPLREFVDSRRHCELPLVRMAGTAVFLNRGKETALLAMRANVERNRVLHRHVVIMSIETVPVPRLPDDERIAIDELGYKRDGIIDVTTCYGYMERPDIPTRCVSRPRAHRRPYRRRGGVVLPRNWS